MTLSDWISIGTTTVTVGAIMYFALCVRRYTIAADRLIEVLQSEDDDGGPDDGSRKPSNVVPFKASA